jgi:hypothetical protein
MLVLLQPMQGESIPTAGAVFEYFSEAALRLGAIVCSIDSNLIILYSVINITYR